VFSEVCRVIGEVSFKNNDVSVCLKNEQSKEACQIQRKIHAVGKLSKDLSTETVDIKMLVGCFTSVAANPLGDSI
jgi:hypothetical protein